MTAPKERLLFVVPAYNEAENLPYLLANIRKFLAFFGEEGEIWVVDDGSSDATAAVVGALAEDPVPPCPHAVGMGCRHDVPVHLLRHEVNRGPGAAFRTGFEAVLAVADDRDLLITVEADNTSDLSVLARMVERARRGFDVVLASVYGEGRVVGAPLERLLLSKAANLLIKNAFGFKGLHTFSSFFRLHRVSGLRQARELWGDQLITEAGFVCVVELLVKFRRLGLRITEVPMLLDSNIRIGDSKMKIVRTTKSYLRLLVRLGLLERGLPEGAESSAAPSR